MVQAAYSLNQRLSAVGASGSVVLLLRNDVFARVSMRVPDSQKMRDDLGVELDWRVLTGGAGDRSPLMRLVDAKATNEANRPIRVLDFFPQSIEIGSGHKKRNIPTLQYFLNVTRHTPRDLLRVFEEVRKVDESEMFPLRNGKIGQNAIREGVLQYSTRYFVNAIRNEFAGYDGGPEAADGAISALRALPGQRFNRQQFSEALRDSQPNGIQDPDRLLKLLFYAGAIGNLVGHDSYMRFYHRRDDSEIYLKGDLIMHTPLCHAWNIPFSI